MTPGTPHLVPAPARMNLGEGSVDLPAALSTPRLIAALAEPPDALRSIPGCRVVIHGAACGTSGPALQGYRLTLAHGTTPVSIESPTPAGARHAIATLAQLSREFGPCVPALDITDAPRFETRGVMLDVSRCRIPTMEEFERILDQLAALKCNHLQLYTEHTFAYSFAQGVWQGSDPITPDEARALDAMARARGIELAPNQNCFGHLRQWLEHPDFAPLAETHGDWMFDVWPRSGPFSLCPTDPRSLALVTSMLDELLPCFRSGLVNIGCDETYDIAFGRSKADVQARGRGVVYAEFVASVCREAARHAKRPMFWADIALSHPECLAALPPDLIALAWGYEPDAPWDRWCRLAGAAGREVWVCPGTSAWRSITGRTRERRANIAHAARHGLAGGAAGWLACEWGDSGHWQTWPVALHALADALDSAWSGPRRDEDHSGHLGAVSRHVHHDPSGRLGAWLDALGDADEPLRACTLPLSRPGVEGCLRNQSAIFIDLFKRPDEQAEVGPPELWARAAAVLDDLAHQFTTIEPGLPALPARELRHTLQLARWAARRGLLRRTQGPGALAGLRDEWRAIEPEHADLWLRRSRPGGLDASRRFFHSVAL